MKLQVFNDIKEETTSGFLKVKSYLSELGMALPAPPTSPSDFQNTLKGLFFVYVYGVFERTITKTIGRTISGLNSAGVKISECKIDLLALVLSPEYDALYGAGDNTKWPKRWNVSKKLIEDNQLFIVEELFPTDGKNIRKKQLESLNKSFGNEQPIFPRPEMQGYLEEVVQYRNYIAHGDMLPQDIGKRFTIAELEKRRENIDELCTYLIDSYERYVINGEYLKTV